MVMQWNGRLALAAAALIGLAACGSRDAGGPPAKNMAEAGEASAAGGEATPVATGGIDDPEAWVMNKYVDRPATGAGTPDGAAEMPHSAKPEYSPRLRALFAEEEKYAAGEVGRLEFDYATGAQDDDIEDVKVSSRATDGAARKVVTANVVNFGKPMQIVYYFEKIGDAWYLDDVASPGHAGADATPWTLSLVLKYG